MTSSGSIKVTLTPCVPNQTFNRRLAPPQLSSLPCPVTLTAQRGSGTPHPARNLTLTFHQGGEIGCDPYDLKFSRPEDLINSELYGTVPKFDCDTVAVACNAYWDLCSSGVGQSYLWDAAQAGCKISSPAGKTPWGDFRTYLYDGFVWYLHDPDFSSDLRSSVINSSEPLNVAWIVGQPPSKHDSLAASQRLQDWLKWLSKINEWPHFEVSKINETNQ